MKTKAKAKPTAPTLIAEGKRQQIDPKLIDPHPHNRQITLESCQGLAQSMRSHGQIQPSTVRPHPTKKGRFQLGAGARRWTAAKINNQPLDCIVRALSDAEIEAMLAVENLQRENPEPREEAAQIRRLFQLPSSTPQSVAAMLGRPDAWVKRRMKLLDLLDPVHEAWQDPDSKLHGLPIASMELIAALSNELQMDFLEEFGEAHDACTADDVKHYISGMACSLKDATWLDNPATFVPGCGPGGCATSSAATDLFSNTEFADEKRLKCANCLNPACFNKRAALARTDAWQKALAKAPAGYYATTDECGDEKRQIALADGSTLKLRAKWDFHGWKACKKTDPKAKPFLEESNHEIKLTWKAPPKDAETIPKSSAESSVKTPEESVQASIDRVQGKRYDLVLKEMREHMETAALSVAFDNAPLHLLALAHAFGTVHSRISVAEDMTSYADIGEDVEVEDQTPWQAYHEGHTPQQASHTITAVWASVRRVLKKRLHDHTFTDRKSDLIKPEFVSEMLEIAKLTTFDFAAAYRRAATACKPPASLKHLDPVTLQPTKQA